MVKMGKMVYTAKRFWGEKGHEVKMVNMAEMVNKVQMVKVENGTSGENGKYDENDGRDINGNGLKMAKCKSEKMVNTEKMGKVK